MFALHIDPCKMAVMFEVLQIYSASTRWNTRMQPLLPIGIQFFNYSSAGRFIGLLERRHVFVVLSRDATRPKKERVLRPNFPFWTLRF